MRSGNSGRVGGQGFNTRIFSTFLVKLLFQGWTSCGAASFQEQRNDLHDCSREFLYLLCHPSASSALKFPGPVLQAASYLNRGEMCLLRKSFFHNECHCRSQHFNVTAHIHESAGQISSRSSLLHHLRSFQPKKMTFPELLPPVLLEASAQVIQPPKTLTPILLTVGGKGAPNAAFSISICSPASLSSQVAHKNQDFFLLLLTKSQNSLAN